MEHKGNSDLQLVFHLMFFFLEDLNQAIVQQELLSFLEVPQLYTAFFPPPATISRGSEKTEINDTSPHNPCGGGSGGGLGGSNKRGDDNPISCSQGGNLNQTKSDSLDKDKSIFIVDKIPHFKCAKNKDGADQPPKITADGKEL